MTTTPTPTGGGTTVAPAALIADPAGAVVVDVRSAAEFGTRHIDGSYHVPLDTVAEHADELAGHLDGRGPVVLACQSGARAEQARRHLAAAGVGAARVLEGGVPAYAAAGGTVVTGRRAWAMERQVRLVAGSLVLTGVLGGRFVHPRLRLLAGGIGTGLTFSALSNTCAMGSLLARLPFNRDAADPDPRRALDSVAGGRPGPVR